MWLRPVVFVFGAILLALAVADHDLFRAMLAGGITVVGLLATLTLRRDLTRYREQHADAR
jgi:hypothetical protein